MTDLREMIVRCEIRPGAPIREKPLSERLNISRTPVREALRVLESEGLVNIRRNQGARVSPINLADSNNLFETVAGIERHAAELAAVRHTAAEYRKLEALQTSLEQKFVAGEIDSYFEANQRVHRLIVAMAHNDVLQSLHDWIFGRVRRLRYFALSADQRWHHSVDEHRAILEALRRRQPLEAGALIERHVLETGSAIAKILGHKRAAKSPSRPRSPSLGDN